MTTSEFDESTSSPRHGFSVAKDGLVASSSSYDRAKPTATDFRAHSSSSRRSRWNGQRRTVPVELLSARIFRLRIGRGYSIVDLATNAGVLACTIQRLEAGERVDKRVLPPIAAALGIPLCRLVCGEHDCVERACVPPLALRH